MNREEVEIDVFEMLIEWNLGKEEDTRRKRKVKRRNSEKRENTEMSQDLEIEKNRWNRDDERLNFPIEQGIRNLIIVKRHYSYSSIKFLRSKELWPWKRSLLEEGCCSVVCLELAEDVDLISEFRSSKWSFHTLDTSFDFSCAQDVLHLKNLLELRTLVYKDLEGSKILEQIRKKKTIFAKFWCLMLNTYARVKFLKMWIIFSLIVLGVKNSIFKFIFQYIYIYLALHLASECFCSDCKAMRLEMWEKSKKKENYDTSKNGRFITFNPKQITPLCFELLKVWEKIKIDQNTLLCNQKKNIQKARCSAKTMKVFFVFGKRKLNIKSFTLKSVGKRSLSSKFFQFYPPKN
ncbi:hypothetical protein VP01_4201g1 [Puccinia sorghi]|uniref:Uncharacterized protein n=1 Tax=Puccinia sorghi TaxID=27349 RepID=A0A0L6UQQ8_9BASI|nr:hypothetical protein VP01_4201g1 [Puccinia sorghi]